MADNKEKKKSPFSIYWIYAIIGIAIIGFQLFMSSASSVTVNTEEIFTALARQGYVEDAKLVNKVRVDFLLTDEGFNYVKNSKEDEYEVMREALKRGSGVNGEITFSVKIMDAGTFSSDLKLINSELIDHELL